MSTNQPQNPNRPQNPSQARNPNLPHEIPPSAATTPPGPVPTVNWLLVIGLGAIALVRPITNTVLEQMGLDLGPVVPLGWTLVISLLWIAAVGLTRTSRPVLTLTLTGIAYAMFALLLSGILSSLLLDHLQGPLANPIAIVPMLLTNAIWGVVTGALALAVQTARGSRPRTTAGAR